jgi:hypothetical protein
MRDDIKVGAIFPDYELPDHTDTPRKLSFLQGDDPMVVTLNRGVYCPKDRQQLLALAAFYPQICVGYTRLVTIIAENLIMTNDLRLGIGAYWPFCMTKSASCRRISISLNTLHPLPIL